jgi:hypothetical protein
MVHHRQLKSYGSCWLLQGRDLLTQSDSHRKSRPLIHHFSQKIFQIFFLKLWTQLTCSNFFLIIMYDKTKLISFIKFIFIYFMEFIFHFLLLRSIVNLFNNQ